MGRLVRKCEWCNYYESKKPDSKIGECRRQCPIALSGTGTGMAARVWPAVMPHDWCGDYAPGRRDEREG